MNSFLLRAVLRQALADLEEGTEPSTVIGELQQALGFTLNEQGPSVPPPSGFAFPTQVDTGVDFDAPYGIVVQDDEKPRTPPPKGTPDDPELGGGHILTLSDDPNEQRAAAASQKGGEAAPMACAAPGCERQISSSQSVPFCAQHMPKDNVLSIS